MGCDLGILSFGPKYSSTNFKLHACKSWQITVTELDTVFGRGLGLEIGNSFWFFSNSNRPQLSYFDGLTMNETSFAPIIRNMWQSGHIDTLHSWGNFDLGGFTRSIAQMALKELQKYHTTIPIWVNHGIGLNHQKVGNYPNMFGDDPSHKAYHLDFAIKAGCEFFWTGKVTHIKPHGALNNMACEDIELATTLAKSINEISKDLIYLVPTGSKMEEAAKKLNMKIACEIFADRNYEDDGNLVSRKKQNALITDPDEAKKHVLIMVQNQALNCLSGKKIPCGIDSVCIHGDNESSLATAKSIRDNLLDNGLYLKPLNKMKKFI